MKRVSSGKSQTRAISRDGVLITDIRAQAEAKIRKQKNELEHFVFNLKDTRKDLLDRRAIILKGRYYHIYQQLGDTYKSLEVYRRGM
jgi:hypothetical protein